MITQYKNIESIRLAEQALTAPRIKKTTRDQLVRTQDLVKFDSAFLQGPNSKIEFHSNFSSRFIIDLHSFTWNAARIQLM